jgi:hypothetical protein
MSTETRCIDCGRPSKECVCTGEVHMKPLLAVAIKEAVKLALIDCCLADAVDAAVGKEGDFERWAETSQRLKAEWTADVYSMPADLFARMDPLALAQNVAVRLLGPGHWHVNGVYAGNATPRELLEATVERPDQDPIAEIAFDLGLRPIEDGEAS